MKLVNFDILIEENTSINKLASGGLVLPNIGTLPMAFGRVIKVGPGRTNKKTGTHVDVSVAVGDLVVYNPGVAKPIKLKNMTKPVFKMKENEAMLVLEEDSGDVIGIKKMLHNYILISRDEQDTVSFGGIVIPEVGRTIDNISGTVYMTGPGTYNPDTDKVEACRFIPGDKVSFTEMSSIQLTLPIKGADGKIVKKKFCEVPDSLIDFAFNIDKKDNMNITKIKDKHVMVTRDKTAKQTTAGIYVPEMDAEGHMVEAEVIMVGAGVENTKIGDRILYVDAKENNKEFKIPVKTDSGLTSTKKCYMVPEKDIEAWLEDDESL